MSRARVVLFVGSGALLVAAACGGPQKLGDSGATCFRDDDCAPGLICVAPSATDLRRVCSNDPTPLISTVEGPPAMMLGGSAGAAGMAAAGGGAGNGGATGGNASAGSDPGGTDGGGKGGSGTAGKAGGGGMAGTSAGGTDSGTGGGGTAGTAGTGGTAPEAGAPP